MHPDLQLLLDLKPIDEKKSKKIERLQEIPTELEQKQAKIKELEASIVNEQDEINNLQKQSDKFELDIKSYEEELKKLLNSQMTVKTNKEYSAIQKQIDDINNKVSNLETEELMAMEKISAHKQILDDNKNDVNEKINILKSDISELKNDQQQIENEIKQLENQSNDILKNVDEDVKEKYLKIMNRYKNAAVVPVTNLCCGGCYKMLPPADIDVIKKNDKINYCEHCARIIYWDENE